MLVTEIQKLRKGSQCGLSCHVLSIVMLFLLVSSASAEDISHATKKLFDAVWNDDLVGVKSSVMAGANVSAVNELGSRPVDMAVDRGYFEIAHYLLSIDRQRSNAGTSTIFSNPRGSVTAQDPRAASAGLEAGSRLLVSRSPAEPVSSVPEPIPAPANSPELAAKLPVSSPPVQEKLWSPDGGSSNKQSGVQILSVARPNPSVSPALTSKNTYAPTQSELAETPISTEKPTQPKAAKQGLFDRVAGLFKSSREERNSSTSDFKAKQKAEKTVFRKPEEPSSVGVSETLVAVERPVEASVEGKERDEPNLKAGQEQSGFELQDISQSSVSDSLQAMPSPAEGTSVNKVKKPKEERFLSRIAKLFGAPKSDTEFLPNSEAVNKSPKSLDDAVDQPVSEPGMSLLSSDSLSGLDATPITEEASLKVQHVQTTLKSQDLISRASSDFKSSVPGGTVDPALKASSDEGEQLTGLESAEEWIPSRSQISVFDKFAKSVLIQMPSPQFPEPPALPPTEIQVTAIPSDSNKNVSVERKDLKTVLLL